MRAKSKSEGRSRAGDAQAIVQELRLSDRSMRAISVLRLPADYVLEGAVRVRMLPVEAGLYRDRSETLIRGIPLVRTIPPPVPKAQPPKHSAKDLIAELQSINNQIHRMMFQVERAVANLAMAG